jgi:hypothetical protein
MVADTAPILRPAQLPACKTLSLLPFFVFLRVLRVLRVFVMRI